MRRFVVSLLLGIAFAAMLPAPAQATAFRALYFPTETAVSFRDSFGDCRDGCTRGHEGNDLYGPKLTRLLSAVNGTVTFLRTNSTTKAGNTIEIRDAEGWYYRYLHVNNDTPGTDDGANPLDWMIAPGLRVGVKVSAGQFIGYLGDSGNADDGPSELHFEMRQPDFVAVSPWWSLKNATHVPKGTLCQPSAPTAEFPSESSAAGYWVVGSDGGVFTYGNVAFYGSTGGMRLNQPVIAIAARASRDGYWLIASDGGVFSFGNARFQGSTGGIALNQPVVGVAATPSGNGYWLVASDGGVFAFGDAAFFGSTGGIKLNQPVVGIGSQPSGNGYTLVGRDGGVFVFGAGGYFGSVPAKGFCQAAPAVGIAISASGNGYWITLADGSVFAFGDAKTYGDPSNFSLTIRGFALGR